MRTSAVFGDQMWQKMNYNLLLPQRVIFGWGRRAEVGALAADLGRRAFLVVGSRTLEVSGVVGELRERLTASGIDSTVLASISAEPDVAVVDDAARRVREHSPGDSDMIITIGGGSAMDLGKAIAALATNTDGASVRDHLEGIGRGLTLTRRPLPLLGIPTTAGTGSEATKNAVISSADPPVKKSLRSDWMMPRCVIIDPELTVSNPTALTAHSGMDAVTQLIESYISCRAQPVPRALCIEGLQSALPALPRAVRDGADRAAREAMAHAAFLSGVALANSGLGIAHGVAAALGVHCGTAHGLACAVLLPVALRLNRQAARHDFAELARRVLDVKVADDVEAAGMFIEHVIRLERDIGIPMQLSELGVSSRQIPALVRDSRGNSRDGNPWPIPDAQLQQALEAAL
jgi:alcohol dehydrogenase class IV